jgi:hypothetical protein
MTDRNKKLDAKVGEVWQVVDSMGNVKDEEHDKIIIYIDSKRIIAENSSRYDKPYDHVFAYDLFGNTNGSRYVLHRCKPEIKVVNTTVYVPVFKSICSTPYLGAPIIMKNSDIEKHHDFIKWIELTGSAEVEC